MINILVIVLLSLMLVYLGGTTLYLLGLSLTYYWGRTKGSDGTNSDNRFAILVPAHNEELLIGKLCQSLQEIDYPKDKYTIYVVADNCSDGTAEVCREQQVTVIERSDKLNAGKGQALDWGLKQINLEKIDAVFIVDADNFVDPGILKVLSHHISAGEQAIQCYNAVGNRDDSWFTQLLYVSRVIGNQLYHEAKYNLGLSSYLMGNGLCFRAELLNRRGWTAFSAGEDWEYYAHLIEDGISIGFAARAKVFHQESKSLDQATSQRLRWSSGRFSIAKKLGLRLLLRGMRERKWKMVDASFPLILPNYSLLVNLTFLATFLTLFISSGGIKIYFILAFLGTLMGQIGLFLLGAVIAGSPGKVLCAMLYAPFFLVWKATIDILCVTGLYRGKKWVRTKRHL